MARGIMAPWGTHQNLHWPLWVLFLAARWSPAATAVTAPKDAAKQLASAVSALDVGSVAFEGKDSGAANDQLKEIFKGLDPAKPAVESGELTLESDTATVPLNYSWKIGSGEWKYTTSAELKKSGDKWLTVWNPATLVPELAEGEIVGTGTQSPSRADILGAGGVPLVTYRPVVNVGIDKPALGGADPADSATKLAQLVGVDPAAYAQQVAAAGPEAFVAAITLREDGRTITDDQIGEIPGARAIRGLPAAGTHPHLRPRPAGHRSRGERRTDREIQRGAQGRGHHGHRWPAAAIRRAAARQRRHPGLRREGRPHRRREGRLCPTAGRRVLFQTRDESRHPAENHPGPEAAAARGRRPRQGRPGVGHCGAPALQRRRPGGRLRAGQQRLRHRDAGTVRPRIDLQDGRFPGHVPQRHDARFQGGLPAPPSPWTAAPSRTPRDTPSPPWAP